MASLQVQKETSSHNKHVKQPQNGAQVTMVNQTNKVFTLDRTINWSGTPASPGFPSHIQANEPATFTHLSDDDFGSTGAVIYRGFNSDMQPCAWVLAWDAPAESQQKPNKVYVTCGPKGLIDAMELTEIRNRLRESRGFSNAKDCFSKTRAQAQINDLVPFKAVVGANFGNMA